MEGDSLTGRLRGRLDALRDGGRDAPAMVGLVLGGLWVLLVLGFWLLGPAGEGTRSGAARLATLAGILLPLVLIALAVTMAQALAGLREEADELRRQLAAMRAAGLGADGAVAAAGGHADPSSPAVRVIAPARAQPAAASRPGAARTGARARPAEAAQPALDLGAAPAVEIAPPTMIAAMNFPDGPEDHVAISALREALVDPEMARLIRAAQDIITLLAARGLYMDDLTPPASAAAAWRRLAEGGRGAALAGLADASPSLGPEGEALLSQALREDEIFRDAAHHFLRHWDRMLARMAPRMADAEITTLAATRSGRAFAALARATGTFG